MFGWFIKYPVETFQPLIVIHKRSNRIFGKSLGMYINLSAIVLSLWTPPHLRKLNRKLLCKYDETQGSKGIRQCQVKIMYIPNDDTQNYPFCTLPSSGWNVLESQLNEPTNQNLKKVFKLLKQLIWKLTNRANCNGHLHVIGPKL